MVKSGLDRAGAALERLDPERRLALAYVPRAARPSIEALWSLDAALGAVIAAGGQPIIRQAKLAWWREALEALDSGQVPPEPVLSAVAGHLPPAGISGADLARMAEGWEHLIVEERLGEEALAGYAAERGGRLFSYSARLLGGDGAGPAARIGEGWSLVDLARRSSSEEEAAQALSAARERLEEAIRWPTGLRPLGMLGVLARRDAWRPSRPLEARGAPARILRMIAHHLAGR